MLSLFLNSAIDILSADIGTVIGKLGTPPPKRIAFRIVLADGRSRGSFL
ncbi:MAG: hypothetical protein HC942_16270 [Microcoleus sp. SU_5_6]|nr:hypothetical protein [Microcoleus sp. SU_5_6]